MTTRPEFGPAGVRLRELIERYGPLRPESALAVLRESLIGLSAARERGAVLPDYRPENMLIDRNGGSRPTGSGAAVPGSQPPNGPSPYHAPELPYGAPVGWASDVYAATAVFFECLTGLAPSPERIRQFRLRQAAAGGPGGQAAEQLHDLAAWGMAASPADRPANAGYLITELDGLATAWYGPDWNRRGHHELAGRVADALAQGGGVAGNAGRGSRPGGHRSPRHAHRTARRPGLVAGVAAVTVAVLGLAGTAFALSGHNGSTSSGSAQGAGSASTSGPLTVSTNEPSGGTAAFTADATVTPAATTSACAAPVTFTVAGTISATGAGTVTYQWTGSSGITGQVQTLHFGGAGTQRVTGTTVQTKAAGAGWAAIKIVSPQAATSNKATYILDCSTGPVTVSATAAVTPAHSTVKCGAAPPSATFTGTINDTKPGTVTYYWALPAGNGPTRSLTFSAPGTQSTAPATVTAASDTSTQSGTLVVLSPAAVSSNTATFSVSCTQPAPTGSPAPSTTPTLAHPPNLTVNLITNQIQPKTVLCGSTPPGFQVFATITSDEIITNETYHWVWPDGTTTAPRKLNVQSAPGGTTNQFDTSANATFFPASDTFSGNATLVFTSPVQGSWSLPLTLACTATGSTPPPAPPVQILTPASGYIVNWSIGDPFSMGCTAKDGTGPYTWSVTGLPPGLAINAATGTISGMPTTGGSYHPTVTVTDSSSPAGSYSVNFFFRVPYPPIVVSVPPLPDGTVGTAYPPVTFSATGGDGHYAWSLNNGDVLPGLSMSSDGVLSGIPTTAGTFSVDITVNDDSGDGYNNSYTLVINPASLRPTDPAYQLPHSSAGSGSSGGVMNAGGAVRSSAPSGAIAAASRLVSAGRFHFSSTSLSTEVWSNTSDRTQSGRA
jgi:serine/threonine-protein kinase